MTTLLATLSASLLIGGTGLVFAPAAHADTTVLTESFESSSSLPVGWKLTTFTAGISTASIGDGAGADGSHFLKIVSTKPNHARVVFPVTVTPGASYHFQAQAKATGTSDSSAAAVLGVDGQYTVTDSVRTGDAWQPLDLYVTIGNQTTLNLTAGLGNFGQLNAGEADFDSLSVTQVDSVPTDAKTVITLAPDPAAASSSASASTSSSASASAPASSNVGGGPKKSILVLVGALAALLVVVGAFLTLRGGPSADPTAEPRPRGDAADATLPASSEAPAGPTPVAVTAEKTHFLDVPAGR